MIRMWCPGLGVALDCIDSDLCLLTYFEYFSASGQIENQVSCQPLVLHHSFFLYH